MDQEKSPAQSLKCILSFPGVFKFLMTITKNLNNKLPTLSLFIDFKKAFDTISHKLLVRKLPRFNLSENTIAWIGNYLTNRSQSTFANGITSSRTTLMYGVPQGPSIIFSLC